MSSGTREVTCFWHAEGQFCDRQLVVSGAKAQVASAPAILRAAPLQSASGTADTH